MKNYLKILTGNIFLLMILISSCIGPGNEIVKMIPETALAVVTVNPGQVIEKSRMQEIPFLKEEVSENAFMSKIFEDPESSGILLDAYSAFFILPGDVDMACVVMPVKSESDFETMISELEREVGSEFVSGKIENFRTKQLENVLVCYNQAQILMVSAMDGWSDIDLAPIAESVIRLEKDNALVTDRDFNNFLGKQKDINAWITSNNIDKLNEIGDFGEGMDMFGGVKNNYGHIFLDFQKGYMTLRTNLRFNASWKETIDKYNFLDEKAIKELLTYLPSENLLFVGNTNMDPEKIVGLLKLLHQDFRAAMEELESEMGIDENDLVKIFSGEVAFSFNTNNVGSANDDFSLEDMPGFVYAARIRNESSYDKFINLAETHSNMVDKGEYYEMWQGFPAYITKVKKDMIISNSEDIIKEIIGKGKLKKNVTTAPYKNILTSNPVCFFLNLDKSTYTEDMQRYYDEMTGKMPGVVDVVGPKLKSLTFSAELEEWEFRIDLKDNSENFLYAMLKEIDK